MEAVVADDTLTLRLTSLRLRPPLDLHFQNHYDRMYLVESCGHIYSLLLYWVGQSQEIKVWELDLKELNWVEVKCLDGRAFFIGQNNCSTWCWGSMNPELRGGVEANCVYFVLPRDIKTVHSYNLQDQSLTLLLPCQAVITRQIWPIWVMPQHHQSLLAEPERKQRIEILDVEYEDLPLQNEIRENLLWELPLHIIEIIAKYMHLFDYSNFLESSRILRSALPPPQWRTHNSLPLCMFFKAADGLCTVIDPCRDDSLTINLELSQDLFIIDFSKDGWLLMRVGENFLHSFNPFTGVGIEFLVPTESMSDFASFGFSTCPTSPDCLVVGIYEVEEDYGDPAFGYFHCGDKRWNHYVCDRFEYIKFYPVTSSPVYHAGAFYFLGRWGLLGVFELVGGEATWQVYENLYMSDIPYYSIYSSHLVECDGELLSVFLEDMGKSVKVFRFNQFEKNWVEEKSLGNYSLFLGPSSSFSAVTTKFGIANRIYLSRLRQKRIVFYSLDTCKYHVSNSEEFMDDIYGTTELRHCWWI